MSTIDRMKNNISKNISYYLIIIIKNNYTMTKLWLIISHISFMPNEWNVPHHVLNDYCPQWL
jgi:hypothetical protein